jgi:hypothetical protein
MMRACTLSILGIAQVLEDTRAKKADMPTARECCSSIVNGKSYAIGGLMAIGFSQL